MPIKNKRLSKAGAGLVKNAFLSSAFAFSVFCAPVWAQEKTLTLEDAYSMAIANHEAVRIAGEGVVQAESSLKKATSRILPNVTAEAGYTRYTEKKMLGDLAVQPDYSSRADLKISQPLYSGGREWATRRQARLGIERSNLGVEAAKEDVVRATARAFFGALKAARDVEIKDAALKRADERLKVASARFRVGEVTKTAVLRAEADLAGAEAELISSKSGLIDALNNLRRITGVTEDVVLAEPSPRAQETAALTVEELVKKAFDSRRDYRQSALDERSAGEGITYAKGGFYPSLRLEGLYSHKDQDPQTTFFVENSTSATINFSFPIFEGFLRTAELSEARSKFREAELRRLGLRRDIEVNVRDSYNNLRSVRAVIDSYSKQLSFAEENYRMVFEQFKYGLVTSVDVIDADTTLISAQRSLSNARFDAELAALELKYATGTLLESALASQGGEKAAQ